MVFMKKLYLLSFAVSKKTSIAFAAVLLCLVFKPETGQGQAASATWTLTSSTTPGTTGNVTAAAPTFGSGLSTTGTNNFTYGFHAKGWPAGSGVPNPTSSTQYFQFSVTPNALNSLSITSLTLISYNNEPSPTDYLAIFYSTDPTFATSTSVISNFNMPAGSVTYSNSGLAASAASGQTLYFRVYFYYASSGVEFGATSLVLSGTTASTATISTGSISGSPFCVTSSVGASVSVPFTSVGTFSSNTYTAQLSNASGSFAAPVTIGTLVSNANSGTISATIPANTATGAGYRIRVISSSPSVTGTDNGANLTINLSTNSIAPTGTQNINAGVNGTTLTVTETPAASSRIWYYGTASGGPYSTNTGVTATTYTPNFAAQGTYYIVCVSTYSCGNVTSNQVQVNVSATVTTSAISGSPFCVTASAGASVSVPFTSAGTFSGNTYTAQLSNASGSFAAPVTIGTLVSNANSGTISATIPANSATGAGYRIRVISSSPSITGTDDGTNLTINLAANSIAPTATQTISAGVNGTTLTVAEQSTATSRVWYYGTTSGGPYSTNTGITATTYTPNFAVPGTYYIVCQSTFSCGVIVSNQVQVNVLSVTTSSISGSPFCVTASIGASVSVPFASIGTFSSNTYSAQLSDAAGSFATPVTIGTLVSNANSGTITGTIPANTATGAGYRIRVISSGPSITGTDNGANLTINLSTNSIAPSATQNINAGINGTALTVTETPAATSRTWYYGTTSGGPYGTNTGVTTTTYTPNFAAQGTYYIVCVSTYACGNVTSNQVQVNVSATVTTNAIGGSPFCVTASVGASVSVPFTSAGTFSGNNYTAQLSNAAGSFAAPVTIGTLVSNANSGTISATLPANTATGAGYRIRIISSSPSVTGTDNGTNLTINLSTNSIAPSSTQNINAGVNGTVLTVTETPAASSRTWYYGTTSGGPYSTNTGVTTSTYTPNFAAQGTYYIVCVSTYSCGNVTSNQVQVNVSATVTTSAISGSPFCVTASAGASVSVPFTSGGTFSSNTYTAQLSNASGSFAAPVTIGTLVSNSNSGTITASIPANSATGTGYRIRVMSSSPSVTGTDNGTNLTINLAANSIAPVTTQNINSGVNGTSLGVSESSAASSRTWYYGTTSGGPYATSTGVTGTTYTPNFVTQGTYYVVCISSFACGNVTSNQVQVNVTATVTTGALSGYSFCAGGAAISVAFTSAGTFGSNTYTAQLSDAFGSFASPVNIGSLLSNANSGSISATIPSGASAGNGYLIRVAASNPSVVGSSSGAITINALPTITSVTATPATICNGNTSNLIVTVPAASATTIVNYDFNSGTSYGSLSPTLASNISSSATSSTAAFATASGTATDGSAFTTNGSAGNALVMTADGTSNWVFTMGGANLNKYTSFKFYFQAESFSFFGAADPYAVSVAYSLNGGSFITAGLSATTLAPGAGSFVSGVFTLPASVNNPTTTLAIRITPAASFFGSLFETETIDNFQVQAVASNSYSWSASPAGVTAGLPGTAGSSLITNNNISVLPTVSTAYTVSATNVNGCQQTSNVTVTVSQKSAAPTSVTATATTICLGSSTSLSLNGGGGGTGEVIKWYTGSCGGALVGTGNGLTVNPLVNTIYYGRYEDGAPCNYTTACASILITVTPTVGTPSTPTPSVSTICQASAPTTYTTSATNAISYNWTVTGAGNIISGTGTTATVTWAAGFSGTATVSVTANGCNGPSAAASTTVTVTPTVGIPSTPTPSATTICQASGPTTYTTSATNATSYNWSVTGAGNTISGTGITATVTWAAGFSGTATVSVTANGCNGPSAAASTAVTVTPTVGIPSAPTPSATTICQASGPTTYTTSATNATSYNWSVTGAGNMVSGTGTTATVTWAAGFSGPATVSVTANGCNGPSAAASTTVTVTPTVGTPSTPSPSATAICQASSPTTYTTSAANATSYNWSITGAGNSIAGTGTTATVTWAAGFTGAATVSVTANGCNGPSSTSSTTVTVTPAPSATVAYGGSPYCSIFGTATVTQTGTLGGTYSSASGLSINASTGAVNTIASLPGTYTVTYSIAPSGGCSVYTTTATITIVANTWIGVTSTDWNDGTNWSCGTPPTAATDVTINTTPHDPVVSTAVAMTHSLTIATGVSVTVTGQKLQIAGVLTNSGTFDASNGTIEMNGSSAQSIPAGAFLNNAVSDLVITNAAGVTLGGAVDVYNSLTYGMSGAILNTGGVLTLKSTATQTAWIGDMTGHTINGNVTVERYIGTGTVSGDHAKSWQFLAIPTQGQTIKQSWMEGSLAPNDNLHPGYGTQITGSGTGFDVTTSTPSMKVFNTVNNGYIGVSGTGIPVYNQKGYFIFVRGDRSVTNPFAAPIPTILRTTGSLFTPANMPPVTVVNANSSESVGNPYASAIDVRNIGLTGGVTPFFTIWDPRLGSASGYGAFQTLTQIGSNFYAVPGGTASYPGYPTPTNYIQSGQAFLAQTATGGTSGTVTFDESAKAGGNSALFTTPNPVAQPIQIFNTTLSQVSVTGTTNVVDGALAVFSDSYSNAIDGRDGRKSVNSAENLGILTGGKLLAVDSRATINSNDTIFFSLSGVSARSYRLHFDAENLNPLMQGYLVDRYTSSSTVLNMTGTTDVNFTVTSVAGSYAANRFMVVFAPAKVLPVTFTSITATAAGKHIDVQWRVDNEMNITGYEVEKSVNGTDFSTIATALPTSNNGGSAVYVSADGSPAAGYNYYRVKSVDVNGVKNYSAIVKVLMGSLAQSMAIYPNPVTDGMIHLQLKNQPQGYYTARLINKLGQVIAEQPFTYGGGNGTQRIKINHNLAHGMYDLQVSGPSNSPTTINVIY